jgi:hypothetical protein
MRPGMTLFDKSDAAYQEWLLRNETGYVINTPRNLSPSYMVLHRASCKTIRQYNEMAREGGFTERQYVKVCATTIGELRDWVRTHGRPDGSFSRHCPSCGA